VAVGQGRGARVERQQKGDTAIENERAISVGRSNIGNGVVRGKREHRWQGRIESMI